MSTNQVVVRIRPFSDDERRNGGKEVTRPLGEQVIVLVDPYEVGCGWVRPGWLRHGVMVLSCGVFLCFFLCFFDWMQDSTDILRKNRSRERRYAFDRVFSSQTPQVRG